MKHTCMNWLCALLIACLLASAPVALMEEDEVLEAPVAEITAEIGEDAEAPEEMSEPLEAEFAEAEEDGDGIEVIECMDGTICYVDRHQENVRLVPVGGAAVERYESLNPEVARIDKTGLVTSERFGRADIAITLKSGEVMTVHVGITGAGGREGSWGFLVPADLNLRMNVGDSLKLTIDTFLDPEEGEVTPIEWRTSDETVATVSRTGVVKAIKPGAVEIEVDLQWPWGGLYANRYIKVVDPEAGAGEGTAIDEQNFPDPVFRDFVSFFYDLNEDGRLSKAEIAGATRLVCDRKGLQSLNGIELLTGLKFMEVTSAEDITSLDLSKNTKLEHLFLEDPDSLTLKTLNLSRNTKLTYLGIEHSEKMSYPDPSAFRKLKEVHVGDLGKVKSLDFSKNDALRIAHIWENGDLTSLKLSKLSRLVELKIEGNEALKKLDVTGNPGLQVLSVVGNDKLKTLDITGCTKLIKLVNSVDPAVDEERDEIIYRSGSRELRINGDMTLTGEGLYPTFELTGNASHTAYVGEIFRLTLGGAKGKASKSSRTSVAKVKKDLVKPVKPGKATISVKLSDGKILKLALTVLDPNAVTIEQGKKASIKVKGTLKLKAVTRSASLTWSSSKPSVARVNAKTGKVTGMKAGTATITVTTDKGKKASIRITVKK